MTRRLAIRAGAIGLAAVGLAVMAQDFDAPIVLPRLDEESLVDQMAARVEGFANAVGFVASPLIAGANAGVGNVSSNAGERSGLVSGAAGGAAGAVAARDTLSGAVDGLADSDRQAQAAFDHDPGPSVPSSCMENAECNACFGPAVERIDFNRYWLLRARILTVNTVKVGKAGLAMLDAVTGMAQAAGPVLQRIERPTLEASLTTLRAKYEEKAGIYLNGLDAGMRALGECEAQHFGTRDWYQRYGYLYVSFMRERFSTAPE
jgi:hypothetical protein